MTTEESAKLEAQAVKGNQEADLQSVSERFKAADAAWLAAIAHLREAEVEREAASAQYEFTRSEFIAAFYPPAGQLASKSDQPIG